VRIELTVEVLQTSALPLGDRAGLHDIQNQHAKTKSPSKPGLKKLERETGIEPATSTLARSHSTAELLPLADLFYSTCAFRDNFSLPGALPWSQPLAGERNRIVRTILLRFGLN
jgi:hypothetical protein